MLKKFLKFEPSGAMALGMATICALLISNSPLHVFYTHLFETKIIFGIGNFMINKPLYLWINDGLMAIFFFLVGLELKREAIDGQLSSPRKIALPILAALGGVIVPAVIYIFVNWKNSLLLRGWAIPTATDIAFALGIISLLGKRVPDGLKITLVAIAIIDDLVSVAIIAFFYNRDVSYLWLCGASILCLGLFFLNKKNINQITPYILMGFLLWICILESGIHATLSGVVLALFIPLHIKEKTYSPLKKIEKDLHPWVTYGVLPLFAFSNAGVSLTGLTYATFYHSVAVGIILGLFFGKQLGVMLATYLAVSLKICDLPAQTTWRQYYGMAILTGVGFTMSLFVGSLSFDDAILQTIMRIGVLTGSTLSGICGYFFLKRKCMQTITKVL
jgi:NhaA family Na+:H+ antiporter